MKLHKRNWYVCLLALALVGVLALAAACGDKEETTTTAAPTETTVAGDQPVEGGTFNIYINEPAFIDPVNLQESEGTQVGQQLFDSLAAFNYKTGKIKPSAAKSWEYAPPLSSCFCRISR